MNQPLEPLPTPEADEVPRWVQVPVGLVLALVVLLLGFPGSIMLVLVPSEKAPILTRVIGTVLVLGCLWMLSVCFRLVLKKRIRGGLLGPIALRLVAWVFLLLPIGGLTAALITGYFSTHTVTALETREGLVETVLSVAIFFRLRSLASYRER